MAYKKFTPQSRAALMASDDIKKVIQEVSRLSSTPFMSERISDSTKRRREVIDALPPDLQELRGILPEELLIKISKMDLGNG